MNSLASAICWCFSRWLQTFESANEIFRFFPFKEKAFESNFPLVDALRTVAEEDFSKLGIRWTKLHVVNIQMEQSASNLNRVCTIVRFEYMD